MQEVTTGMSGTGINNMECVNRENGEIKWNFRHRKMCKHRYSVHKIIIISIINKFVYAGSNDRNERDGN